MVPVKASTQKKSPAVPIILAVLGFFAFAALSALLVGDPIVSVGGTVRMHDGRAAVGRVVAIECPPGTVTLHEREVTTDAAGRFEFRGLGCPPRTCTVSVQGSGLAEVGQFCTRTIWKCGKQSCNFATIALTLE